MLSTTALFGTLKFCLLVPSPPFSGSQLGAPARPLRQTGSPIRQPMVTNLFPLFGQGNCTQTANACQPSSLFGIKSWWFVDLDGVRAATNVLRRPVSGTDVLCFWPPQEASRRSFTSSGFRLGPGVGIVSNDLRHAIATVANLHERMRSP